jgi:hypothetical protein
MTLKRRMLALVAAGALAAGGAIALEAAPPTAEATTTHTPATMIEKLTGPGAVNNTWGRWDIKSTDLGIMWDNGSGQVLTAFGDTFGNAWTGPGGGAPANSNWRSNVLVRSTDTNLADGMYFATAATASNGLAKELIPSQKVDNVEITVIPTAGISVGTRQYLGFMSVRHWGAPGYWDTNRAGIAYSDDNGQTWINSGVTWENPGGTNHFQMQSYVKRNGYVYVYATPNGRNSAAYVARVPEAQLLTKSAYQYWNGSTWVTNNDAAAVAIAAAPVSELSVQYNATSGKYLMMYLSGEDIILRTATNPEGPWSAAQVVVSSADYPGLYGGFMHPWNSGGTIYFAMSQWNPYNVYLMKVSIDAAGIVTKPNLLGDPSFERGVMGSGTGGLWGCSPNCGIDNVPAGGYSGDRNGYTRYNTGWRNVWQQVAVTTNTSYQLTGYIRTSANSDNGFFGVRTTGGTVIGEAHFTAIGPWTRYTVTFNSGANTQVVAYAGVWTDHGDIWIQLDDFSLAKQ